MSSSVAAVRARLVFQGLNKKVIVMSAVSLHPSGIKQAFLVSNRLGFKVGKGGGKRIQVHMKGSVSLIHCNIL